MKGGGQEIEKGEGNKQKQEMLDKMVSILLLIWLSADITSEFTPPLFWS